MRDSLPELITIIAIILLCIVIIFGFYTADIKHDDKLWNNGHCDVCGGTWEYEQAVGHMYSTSYIYVCEDCDKMIELSEMKGE